VLKDILDSWSALYSNHAVLRSAIEFLHIGGTAAGGGCAVVVDLATITAARESAAIRPALLQVLKWTHTTIVAGLAAIVISGVLLFAADVDSFLFSRIFWLKMGLMVLLLANGAVILRVERQAIRGDEGAWSRLNLTATASLVFWTLTVLAGTALLNIG